MPRTDGFNDAILDAISDIATNWAARGYDINSYFTHDLPYGPDCCVKANHAPKTMCVAAVTEIIITTLNKLYAQTSERRPFESLPLRSWKGGTRRDIRAHIFMYDGVGCNGTGHALERFGIGRQVSFSKLEAGDFINFNRASSGHSCVFLAYLDASGNDVPTFGPSVVGYRYFSAQGKGLPDAGFGYRWAFFDGHCPQSLPQGRRRDCGITRSDNPKLLCCGYLFHPTKWPDAATIDARVRSVVASGVSTEATGSALEAIIDAEMTRELPPPDLSRFDGVTTD